MLALLLIDTRDPEPEPEPERRPAGAGAAVSAVARWLYPWPVVLAWLFAGVVLVEGAVGAIFALATLVVAFWRLSKVYPEAGLSSHRQ